ncbi:hypothetical protein GE061_017571 [Apolygus lucorum]|uniref:Serpin domain-containing protein n=1 Tax=Apolygus lucorum TaxID=248454 RepID=A0A8S9XCQ3_APOLU|nr:hypothetical protein GE061_017571 [Apolygus lucorum]
MTDKRPNTPEIMSQVNISALTTKPDMQGREGDSEMTTTLKPTEIYPEDSTMMTDVTTNMPKETTKQTSMQEGTTIVMIPETTTGNKINTASSTTMSPSREATTLETSNTVEVSVAETTVVKTVSVGDPSTTSTSLSENEETGIPEGQSTTPVLLDGVTLVIETTTTAPATSLSEDNTVMASESMIDQATTIQQSDVTTKTPNDVSSPAKSEVNITLTTEGTTEPPTTVQIEILTEGVVIQVPTTTTETTTTKSSSPTTMTQQDTTIPQMTTAPPTPTKTTLEMIDSAASENRIAALARQQRSLYSTHKTPERHQSGSNWVPQYHDQRWGHNPSNEFWFFTYTGGENVPAHTYTAYLPFAFIPELSCLALQLPLDDPRYSILILLPEERMGLSQLLYSLQWCPVRAIITHLKMTAVYAVVPAFTIVKHINLVPALAKLGIHSVFDPFRADLSPMTSEPHLFVRTIEQVVTVSLRKYYASNRWFEAAPSEVQQHFVANHPFVYFVLDKETDVTLMAGTIVNPVAHNQ